MSTSGAPATSGAPTAEGPVSHFLAGLAAVLGHYHGANAYFAQAPAMSYLPEQTSPGEGCWVIEVLRAMPRRLGTSPEPIPPQWPDGYGTVERRAEPALLLLDS